MWRRRTAPTCRAWCRWHRRHCAKRSRTRASNTAAISREQLRGIGVIVGSGGGSQEFTEEQYRLYYTGNRKQCSVYMIPTSTIGTLASEISMRFGFRGLEPHGLDRMHIIHRRHRLCGAQHPGGRAGHDGGRAAWMRRSRR